MAFSCPKICYNVPYVPYKGGIFTYGFGFAPFLIMLWSANCGLQFVLAIDGKCPWYIFILSAIIDLFYSTLVTIGICKRLKSVKQTDPR